MMFSIGGDVVLAFGVDGVIRRKVVVAFGAAFINFMNLTMLMFI